MAKVNFSISSRGASGRAEVLIRFSGGRGLQYRLKSGVYCPVRLFDEKRGGVIIPRMAGVEQREAIKAKKQLDELAALLIEGFIERGRATTAEDLRAIIHRYHHPDEEAALEGGTLLRDVIPLYIRAHKLSSSRITALESLKRLLHRFELWNGTPITLDGFDDGALASLEYYTQNEHTYTDTKVYADIIAQVEGSRAPRQRGRNTMCALSRNLRCVVKWCNRMKWTTQNVFELHPVDAGVYGTPYYITLEERNAIYSLDLADFSALEVQRDIFVFHCLIGCRYGDLIRLTKDNIVGGAVEYVPRKTKDGRPVTVRVPLHQVAREIIEKHADDNRTALFPFVPNWQYNELIRKIFTRAGITRKVTIINPKTGEEERRPLNEIASSHLARRTFIGNLYKKVKDPNLIGALSGHKEGSKAFVRYRDIDEDMRRELIDML